jgi:RNA polymerase sigma-70 factor (ECF subfamily)
LELSDFAATAFMHFEKASDEELAMDAQTGNLDAYDEIVRRYQERIWSFLYKFCPHQSELEDLVQDTFIKAYNNLHRWQPTGTFKSWLMRLAVNTGHDFYRKRRNEPLTIAQKTHKDAESDPLEEHLEEEAHATQEHPAAELVERILLELKPDDRVVVTLQYYEKMTLQEISEKMNWSLANTKVKSHRARKKLEKALKAHGIETL